MTRAGKDGIPFKDILYIYTMLFVIVGVLSQSIIVCENYTWCNVTILTQSCVCVCVCVEACVVFTQRQSHPR